MQKFVLATRSGGKLRELQSLVSATDAHVLSLDDVGVAYDTREELLEVHESFEANALAKARWFFNHVHADIVFADDSGLVVDALDGAPGVRSKRWSGRDDLTGVALDQFNNGLLLTSLDQAGAREPATRSARYVCAAAAVWRDGALVMVGRTEGVITSEASGDGGFGYDPYFWSAELGATFASVNQLEKARVSHRGRAFRALLAALRRIHA